MIIEGPNNKIIIWFTDRIADALKTFFAGLLLHDAKLSAPGDATTAGTAKEQWSPYADSSCYNWM